MSMLKKNIWIIIVLVAIVALSLPLVAQEETDEILIHYTQRASDVFDGRHPLISGLNFSFRATTYSKVYDDSKIIHIKDSLVAQYFYSFGKIDSIKIISDSKEKFDSLDINYPNVFQGDYIFNFYPNDTGGQGMAIGYDYKEFDTTVPIGIATIDREYYFLKKLYIHYMNDKKIERKSKIYRFTEHEGFVFPDSLWVIKAKSGIFSTAYFRFETGIYDIKIYR